MKRNMWIFTLFGITSLLNVTATLASEEPERVHLKIPLGELNGTKAVSRDGRPFFQFLGIPYGHVPKRFMESVEVHKLKNGGQYGTEFGSPCAQLAQVSMVPFGTEECLFINVFTPTLPSKGKPTKKLPVLVFIHGGYFITGYGDPYSPQYFMDEDVVVVSINYRLCIFGFLNLNMEEAPGNQGQGLKDQVLALKWIQKNIKDFGGDESKVTVFGEPAGAASVSYLMLSPLSKGLFQRAISQSGTAPCVWTYNGHPEETAKKLAEKVGCNGSNQEILQCFVKMDAADLLKALPGIVRVEGEEIGGVQAIDFVLSPETRKPTDETTIFLPKSPMEMLHELPQDGLVPWIVGFNVWEGYAFTNRLLVPEGELDATSVDELKTTLRRNLPYQFKFNHRLDKDNITDQLQQLYFGDSVGNRENLSMLMKDMMFLHCSVAAAQLYADKGPVYFYENQEAVEFSFMLFSLGEGAPPKPTHGDELTLQWHWNIPFIDPAASDIPRGHKQYGFSKNFIRLWTHFAAHGTIMEHWNGEPLTWNPLSPTIEIQTWLHLKEDAVSLPVRNQVISRLATLESLNVTLAY